MVEWPGDWRPSMSFSACALHWCTTSASWQRLLWPRIAFITAAVSRSVQNGRLRLTFAQNARGPEPDRLWRDLQAQRQFLAEPPARALAVRAARVSASRPLWMPPADGQSVEVASQRRQAGLPPAMGANPLMPACRGSRSGAASSWTERDPPGG